MGLLFPLGVLEGFFDFPCQLYFDSLAAFSLGHAIADAEAARLVDLFNGNIKRFNSKIAPCFQLACLDPKTSAQCLTSALMGPNSVI